MKTENTRPRAKLCNSVIDQKTYWSGLSKENLISGGGEFQYHQGKEDSKWLPHHRYSQSSNRLFIELILPTSYRIVQQYPRSYRFVIDSSTAVQLLYAGRHVELDKSLLLQESLDIELDKY